MKVSEERWRKSLNTSGGGYGEVREEIKLLKTFQVKNQEIEVLANKVERLEKDLGQRGGEITRLIQEKEKAYKEFRKYS